MIWKDRRVHPSDEPAVADERSGPGQPRTAPWWQFQRGSRRPLSRTLAATAGSAAVIAALGAGLGLLWASLAPGVPVVDIGDNGVVVNDPSPEQYIAADGWFTLLGLVFGVLVAIGAWLVLRRDRGPFLLAGVVGGAFVAGHWVAPAIGEMTGRGAYEDWRASAAQGATYLAPPEVHSLGPTLVPAFVAAIVLTLLAGWSNDPDLDQPDPDHQGLDHPGLDHRGLDHRSGPPGYPEPYSTPAVPPLDLADQAGYGPAAGSPPPGGAPGGGGSSVNGSSMGGPSTTGPGWNAEPTRPEPHQPS